MLGIQNVFSQVMMKLNERTASLAFEQRFQQIQKTVLTRTNDKIDKLNDEFKSNRRDIEKLYKERESLADMYKKTNQYMFDNESNINRLNDISSKIDELSSAFSTDGNSTDVSAQDIAKFETLRDELYTQVNNLYYLTLPGVVKPYAILHLKDELDTIKNLTPAVGSTSDATNSDITSYLSTLGNQIANAHTATLTTVNLAYDIREQTLAKSGEVETAILEKDSAAKEKLDQEVKNLKIDAANLLQAISVSYDTQAASTNYLSDAMNLNRPKDPGSILNIFS